VLIAAFAIILAVAALSFRGAGLALETQIPLMALIAVSVGMLVAGAVRGPQAVPEQFGPVEAPAPFWVVFAVFFPAVTGIMAGLGLSGDLKDPVKAIPREALAATVVGFAVYLGLPFVLAAGASPESLEADPFIWTTIAPLGPWLVLPGLLVSVVIPLWRRFFWVI
jgi:amino acid transporter